MALMIENEDIEAILGSAHAMTGLPALLPMPDWYAPESTGYLSFIPAGNGSVIYPQSGDKLEDIGYGMYIQVENVKKTDIEWYMAVVQRYAELAWKTDGSDEWYIKMPDYSVKIEWKNNTATIIFHGEDITFAPGWYIGLGGM